ncbi:Uncharacterised protein [Bordetella pertussis]|nr:Uncharacterised protein [Bordetella pertussis]CFL92680.1 Uncharacterised protein [Bordetella pertussis]CFM04712.1 Uncharacterised protein [Bordetella pertussis]CFM20672.1 Uncharacterised protein [Bordetella pertussis]CFM49188.1 Uncharacterised protein [Bordetella pertussis]
MACAACVAWTWRAAWLASAAPGVTDDTARMPSRCTLRAIGNTMLAPSKPRAITTEIS